MTRVLTPPSSRAFHPSLRGLEDYTGHLDYARKMYERSETTLTRGHSDSLASWLDHTNSTAHRHRQFPAPYHTPPDSNRVKGSILPRSQAGQSSITQTQTMPRIEAVQHPRQSQPIPQLPPPQAQPQPQSQPQVTYQPVPSAPAADLMVRGDQQDDPENGSIATYMQIPSSINSSRGSLSEFAAQITCLFWFESISNLQRVENSTSIPSSLAPLADDAKPTLGFRKWVTTMLSTTQVTQNVILLALMFIHRLKRQNPQVRGKPGSEYRLLTVALMLGNKFLDDNTYTNKTWADVSGISVGEIHIMEVEFLSNMRYNLYTSEKDWAEWSKKLGRFYDYFDKASRPPPPDSRAKLSPPSIPTLPRPQSTYPHYLTPASRPTSPTPPGHNFATRPPLYSHVHSEQPQRYTETDIRLASRKRSLDESSDEPYAKRARNGISALNGNGYITPVSSVSTPFGSDTQTPRLPPPSVFQQSTQSLPNPVYHSAHLPPPTSRAMSMVYPPPSQPHPQAQLNVPHSMAPNGARPSIPPLAPIHDHPQNGPIPHLYPMSTGSPTNFSMTPTAHDHLSPSVYPLNRSSPYRPVRHVHTLLVPPSPTSLQAPPQDYGTSNMHYQPLGKPPSERRTGVVPFMNQDRSPWSMPYQQQYTHGHS